MADGYRELKGTQLMLATTTDGTIAPWEGSHTATGYVVTHGHV